MPRPCGLALGSEGHGVGNDRPSAPSTDALFVRLKSATATKGRLMLHIGAGYRLRGKGIDRSKVRVDSITDKRPRNQGSAPSRRTAATFSACHPRPQHPHSGPSAVAALGSRSTGASARSRPVTSASTEACRRRPPPTPASRRSRRRMVPGRRRRVRAWPGAKTGRLASPTTHSTRRDPPRRRGGPVPPTAGRSCL